MKPERTDDLDVDPLDPPDSDLENPPVRPTNLSTFRSDNKGEDLPPGGATETFNRDPGRVKRAERTTGLSDLQDWMGGRHSVALTEEVVGLGGYCRTLTVLTTQEAVDADELQEDQETLGSWRPRFKR